MEGDRPDIVVLVATRNRARQLERLLSSLNNQRLDGLTCELIVVDNGSTDDTQLVLNRKWDRFATVGLYEGIAGKSRALNRALEVAAGDLFVFTDDDVTACPDWLRDLHQASMKYESAGIFCGPTIPAFPPGTPKWLSTHPFAGAMFAKFAPDLQEGPLPSGLVPFGCNFAVRSTAINGKRFRLDLGPSEEHGPLFGEDTDFVERVQGESRTIIFVPSAGVTHHIEASRIELSWLLERAFHIGRAAVMSGGESVKDKLNLETQMLKSGIETGGLINYYCGRLYQCQLMGKSSLEDASLKMLKLLDIDSHLDLLGESARRFYESVRHNLSKGGIPNVNSWYDRES